MSNLPHETGQRTDRDYYQSRVDITNQGINALLIINGGAAVSMLAFLQAVWEKNPPLAKTALFGIVFYALGVLLAAASHQLRVQVSLACQTGRKSYPWWNRISYGVQIGGLVAFLLGSAVVIIRGLRLLP